MLTTLITVIISQCISSVQLLSRVQLCHPMDCAACQASLSITNFQSLPKPVSIKLVMPYNHLILCHSLHLLPSTFPNIRVFSSESVLHIRWPKYWSFSFSNALFHEIYLCVCVHVLNIKNPLLVEAG